MCLFAMKGDLEVAVRCGCGTKPVVHLSDIHSSKRMHPKDGFRFEFPEETFFQHQRSPTFFARGRTLLRRLKDEYDRPSKAIPHRGEYGGHAKDRGDVNIVTTRVGDPDILIVVSRANRGPERQKTLFRHRQRIELRPYRDRRAWFRALQDSYHPGVRNACLHIQPERTKPLSDELRSLKFSVR